MKSSLKSSVMIRSDRYSHTGGTKNDTTMIPRPTSTIGYVVSGEMEFIWENNLIPLTVGDIYYVPRLSSYRIKYISDTVFTAVHFNFYNEMSASVFRNADIQRILPSDSMSDTIEYIRENIENDICTNGFGVLSKFYELTEYVTDQLVKTGLKLPDERISRAMTMLESRSGRELSIDDIAVRCHMSASHFYAMFKQETGLTPIEYRNRSIIDRAVQLITETPDKSVEEISELAGFRSAAYFRRVFKAHMGVSPAVYRRSIRDRDSWL